MKRWIWTSACASVVLIAACVAPAPPAPATRTFANPNAITITDASGGDPYPSGIAVAAMPTSTSHVTVTLTGLSHRDPQDVTVLLVGPTGAHVLLMANVGSPAEETTNVTLSFDVDVTAGLRNDLPLVSGTYLPTAFDAPDVLPPPAPDGPFGVDLTVFDGTDPNGIWALFVVDDLAGFAGSIANGWSLTITAN